MTNLPIPSRPPRLSEKLRRAIDLRVTQGMSIADACQKARISTAGFHKAMKRAAVLDYYLATQRKFVADADEMRAHGRVLAIAAALDLLKNAKSEAIRARMADFLAGDGKAPVVAVNIDAPSVLPRTGYTFVRPDDLDTPPGPWKARQRASDALTLKRQ